MLSSRYTEFKPLYKRIRINVGTISYFPKCRTLRSVRIEAMFLAHSANDHGERHELATHLRAVSPKVALGYGGSQGQQIQRNSSQEKAEGRKVLWRDPLD